MQRERGVLIRLYDDEKIVAVIRKHWLAILSNIIIVFFLLVFCVAGIVVSRGAIHGTSSENTSKTSRQISNNLGQGALIIFGSAYILSILGYAYIAWFDYYLDVFVITNKRLMRIEQAVLFSQKISETSFQHVQDVSSQIKGVVKSILNVGTVYIETAGDIEENFTFNYIENPNAVSAMILELQKKMWDEEGVKSDLGNERKHTKIRQMNSKAKEDFITASEEGVVSAEIPEKVSEAVVGNERRDAAILPESSIEIEPKEPKQKTPSTLLKNTEFYYNDGRRISSYGVFWQSDQELTNDVREVLNQMSDEW